MKNRDRYKFLVVIIIAYFIVCFLSVLILNSPAWMMDLSGEKSNNAASALSGYTAPVIGLISVILIYMAFGEQRKANELLTSQNNDLRIQGEEMNVQRSIDFTFKLIEQLNHELNNITYRYAHKKDDKGHLSRGSNAILKMGEESYHLGYQLSSSNNVRKVIGLSRSFITIEGFINSAPYDQTTKDIFKNKMKDWFYANLYVPFVEFRNNPDSGQLDSDTMIIVNLLYKYSPEDNR